MGLVGDQRSSGHLTVLYGPMFSGKSSRLREELNRYSDLGIFKVLYVNSSIDTRNEDEIMSTHTSGGTSLSAKIHKIKTKFLSDLQIIDDYDVIGVDESQFFPDLLETVLDWVDSMSKIVICVGLDGSFKRTPFGQVLDLCRHADKSEKLLAKCITCLESHHVVDAPFTARREMIDDEVYIDDSVYLPLCRHHWNQRNKT